MEINKNITKWITVTEYVDNQTGEMLTKKEVEKNYIITKKHKHATIENNTGYIKWTKECTRNGKQQKIW